MAIQKKNAPVTPGKSAPKTKRPAGTLKHKLKTGSEDQVMKAGGLRKQREGAPVGGRKARSVEGSTVGIETQEAKSAQTFKGRKAKSLLPQQKKEKKLSEISAGSEPIPLSDDPHTRAMSDGRRNKHTATVAALKKF